MPAKVSLFKADFLLWLLFIKGRNPERVQENEFDTLVNEFVGYIKKIIHEKSESERN